MPSPTMSSLVTSAWVPVITNPGTLVPTSSRDTSSGKSLSPKTTNTFPFPASAFLV